MTDSFVGRPVGPGTTEDGRVSFVAGRNGWKARLVASLFVSFAMLSFSLGCKGASSTKSSRTRKGSQETTSEWTRLGAFQVKSPDEKGDYEFKGTFPRRYPCQKDDDCTLTYLRPGHCCPDQCEAQAANKEWMAILRRLHYPTCRQWRKTHGFAACGKAKCPVPKGVPKARCIEHRCRVAYRPVVARVKYKTVTPPRLTGPPEKPGRAGPRSARQNRVQ